MILLSVIVPVFRVEQYLDQCVQSLLHQDLRAEEYEIILVDDGSDDNSPVLCDQYAAQYPQVRVIHQQNKGLSGARNTGIRAAKGKYLCFVDSDDYLEPHSLKSLIEKAEQNEVDMLRFGLQVVYDNKVLPDTTAKDDTVYRGETFMLHKMSERCSCSMYLILTRLITDTETYFTEGITYEDIDWTPRILLQAKRIICVPDTVYNYVQHTGSITHPRSKAGWQSIVSNNIHVLQRLQQTSAKASESKPWFNAMSSSIICSVLTIVSKHLYEERNQHIQDLQSIYPLQLESIPSFSRSERIKIAIAHISPDLYCFIRHYL